MKIIQDGDCLYSEGLKGLFERFNGKIGCGCDVCNMPPASIITASIKTITTMGYCMAA